MNGILNLNKPAGFSSHDMVSFTRKLLNEKGVGHTGTLDPIATGVLPVLVGNSTKLCEMLSGQDKKYRAVLRLGIVTDTMDITGNIIKQSDIVPDESDVLDAVQSFTGEILQTPPIYSAIKINGRKLYEYARKGIEINPEPRKISVYSIEACKINSLEYELDIYCSKGTYIRSLCNDIGEKLKCGGTMSALTRISSGNFDIKDSFSPEYLEEIKSQRGTDGLRSLLISPEEMLKNIIFKSVILDEVYSKQAKNGAAIYISKTSGYTKIEDDIVFNTGDKILMYDSSQTFFAVGEVGEYNNEFAFKVKIFL